MDRAAAKARIAVVVALVVALSACGGESLRNRIDAAIVRLESAVARLGEDLDAGRVRNAALIRQYAQRIRDAQPDLRELVDVLANEGTRRGTMYRSLETRLDDVRAALPDPSARDEAYVGAVDELNSLARAVDPAEFDRALADPLNVLADLSGGTLPRVDAISASASQRANAATELGVGGQLVGNPNYGQWRTDSGGSSFWVWYGQFALMQSLMGPRIGYGAWAGGRDYSYYHDYGRSNYTSPSARQRQSQVENSARRKFSSEGRTFRSPYARQRQGASSNVARAKFASAGRRSSTGAVRTRAGTASVRGFGGGGSRGPSRGK